MTLPDYGMPPLRDLLGLEPLTLGRLIGILRSAPVHDAKDAETMHAIVACLEAAEKQVAELEASAFAQEMTRPIEDVDAELRMAGVDPEALAARGWTFVKVCKQLAEAEKRAEAAEARAAAWRSYYDELEDLIETSRRWLHDSTDWEGDDYLGPLWQEHWNKRPAGGAE